MLDLFKNKNFVSLLSARFITNIGDSMYYIAAMWLVYKLGGSAFYSGVAGFLTTFPSALSFLTGPIVDRSSIKKLLIFSQLTQALLLSFIPIAFLTGKLSVLLVLFIMPIVSFLNQFSFPAENALLPRILPKDARVKGNSLMSFAYEGSTIMFSAISGILVALIGAVMLYMADIATFMIAALLFAGLKLPKLAPKERQPVPNAVSHYFTDLKEGFSFITHSVVGKLLIGSAPLNFATNALVAILPAYADRIGGSSMYGFLLAGLSIGSLAGALMANPFQKCPFGAFMIVGFSLGSVCWLLSAIIPIFLFKAIFLGAAFSTIGAINVLSFSFLQNTVPENFLARSFTVTSSISISLSPAGALIGGLLASKFGSSVIYTLLSFSMIFFAVYVLCIRSLRSLPSIDSAKLKQI